MAKKRLLVVISDNVFYRNYLSNATFLHINQKFDCFFAFKDSITFGETAIEVKERSFLYKYASQLRTRHIRAFNIVKYRFKSLSSSFQFRIDRFYPLNPPIVTGLKSFVFFFLFFVKKILKREESLMMRIFGNKYLFSLYRAFVIKRIPVNEELRGIILQLKPDMVIFPSSAHDPEGVDIVKICQEQDILSLFLVDKWDNLSSKSILLDKPDYVTVWGQQSKEHAIRIQGFLPEQILTIGTPRFDNYFKLRNTSIPSFFDFRYILFVGFSMPFNEAVALKMLNEEIENNKTMYNGVKILYRPHPWRQGDDSIIGMNLNNVVIDPQVKNNYLIQNNETFFQPELDYYPSLIMNALFVVGPLTSMIIESVIFYKRVLTLVYDDGVNFTSPHNAFKGYEHFRGIENLHLLSFCEKIEEMTPHFRKMYQSLSIINKDRADEERQYIIYNDSKPFPLRLENTIENILCEIDENHFVKMNH